jgi:hypothetical protein
MAQFILTDADVSIDSNDISDHVTQVTINYSAELQDDTAMGDTTRSRIGGLKDWSIDIEVHQDFASSDIDSILFPLVGATFTVAVKPTSSSTSSTNPAFTGTAILESYSPITGSVGDLATTTVSLKSAGTLSRTTS